MNRSEAIAKLARWDRDELHATRADLLERLTCAVSELGDRLELAERRLVEVRSIHRPVGGAEHAWTHCGACSTKTLMPWPCDTAVAAGEPTEREQP